MNFIARVALLAVLATGAMAQATADICKAALADCASCVAIMGCQFCSPTVSKTGLCMLATEAGTCRADYYGIPSNKCCMW